jgi:1-deoxy-D-xylulose-5-phosphate reductoisomerase
MSNRPQQLTILGATGSVGVNTLRVVAENPERFGIFALTANRNHALLQQQCLAFNPRYAVLGDEAAAGDLQTRLRSMGCGTEVLCGVEALADVASAPEVDSVMAAIVGGAGLLPTLAAASTGKKVLLANKEALVMSGELFMQAAAQSGAKILPIDSEHNAIFQCLPVNSGARFEHQAGCGFAKIVLTASGGPFLNLPASAFAGITPEQAVAHPNWQMGRKISVDSATLVNKALELIEASYLLATPPGQIDILVHPQSIIHSMVYYRDGSVLAQMGNPDMRTPIAYGLAWPERIGAGVAPLDLARVGKLNFEEPDLQRFPGLSLGRAAAQARGAAPVIFNAANEIAVAAFLARQIGFMQIPAIIDATLQALACANPGSLQEVLAIDAQSRRMAEKLTNKYSAIGACHPAVSP